MVVGIGDMEAHGEVTAQLVKRTRADILTDRLSKQIDNQFRFPPVVTQDQ